MEQEGPGRDAAPDEDVRRLAEALQDRSDRLAAALDEARRRRLEAAASADRAARAIEERDRAVRTLARVRRLVAVRAWLGLRRLGRRGAEEARAVLGGGRRTLRLGGAVPLGERRLRATAAEEAALRDRILGALPGDAPTDGPHVSIILLNRDGEARLRKLLPALAATAYRNLDLTIVDNASTDGSVAVAREFGLPFPRRIIENAENRSFSAANNAAAQAATGELVLFLNNDIIPLEPGWLGYLVDALARTGAVAAGARLVFPRREGPRTGPADQPADLELQHGGITFRWIDGMPRPRNVGGPDAADPALAHVREMPAASAACLLVRRARFLAAGGFDEAYVYGYEDVDLAMRWGDAGERIVVDGRAVLWHDESATRRTQSDHASVERQRLNRRTFHGRWGVRLFRAALLELLDGRRSLTSDPPRLAILGAVDPDGEALEAGFAALGWEVCRSTGSVEAAVNPSGDAAPLAVVADPALDIRRLPRHAVTVGWARGDLATWTAAPWFDEYDLVLAADDTAAATITAARAKRAVTFDPATPERLLALVREWAQARRAAILVQTKDWQEAPISGDYHVARALQRQLERRGIPTSVHLRPTWTQGISTRDDLVIHLWGRYRVEPRPGQTSVLWILYHPELVTDELVSGYDLVLAASDRFAAELAKRTGRPVHSLHQATDPERFRPGVPGPAHELLFVGNSRGIRRAILHDLTGTRHELAVYGRGWDPEFLDPAHLRGDGVPNERLAGYYESAAIVLNDHWPEAAALGFINNRLYDALAAGAFVISDEVDGIDAEFDGGIVTYRDALDLLRLVERYLADPVARSERAARGRTAVLARHTFSDRVDELLRLVDDAEVGA